MIIENKNILRGHKALAEYLGVNVMTVCRWSQQGLLNYKRIGGAFFYDIENLFKEDKRKRK